MKPLQIVVFLDGEVASEIFQGEPGAAAPCYLLFGCWKLAKSSLSNVLSWPQQSHSKQNSSSKLKGHEHMAVNTATNVINSIPT